MKEGGSAQSGDITFDRPAGDTLAIRFTGQWRLRSSRPSPEAVHSELGTGQVQRITFDASGLKGWDTAILSYLRQVLAMCQEHGIQADQSGLPTGVQRLLNLAEAVPERTGARSTAEIPPWLARLGTMVLGAWDGSLESLRFVGETTRAFGRLLRGRARFQVRDVIELIQQCGAEALPIVTLISFLVGLILAFMGAVQLLRFGATIYVADLVGLAMVREMGAVMTAIVMAGRTGAAFAAQIGTMKVTEEVDALTTFGLSPMDFLVLPRILALPGSTLRRSWFLTARWEVRDASSKIVAARQTDISHAADGPDAGAGVAAMSATLAELSREIASALRIQVR